MWQKLRAMLRSVRTRPTTGVPIPSRFLCDDPDYAKYQIGSWSYGKPQVLSWGEPATLRVGRFCSIAEGVTILLGGEHRTDWLSTYPFTEFFAEGLGLTGHPRTKGDVVIGHDVWVGRNALIMSGVTLGTGCVVAAHAVVSKSVPPYTIAAGNPARLIRARFSEDVVERLLQIAWWDWPIERVREVIPILASDDIAGLLRAAEANTGVGRTT